jgi:hypothetical protein
MCNQIAKKNDRSPIENGDVKGLVIQWSPDHKPRESEVVFMAFTAVLLTNLIILCIKLGEPLIE